jgi:hypothetical protein
MDILSIAILLFVLMETANVCILYVAPGSRLGNGVGVFDAWQQSKADEDAHLFAKYLVDWVAGVKLIFIALLVVILFLGDEQLKVFAVIAMILSIGVYFVKLHPTIKQLDARGQITPAGYSRTLGWMIGGFMGLFIGALAIHWL